MGGLEAVGWGGLDGHGGVVVVLMLMRVMMPFLLCSFSC